MVPRTCIWTFGTRISSHGKVFSDSRYVPPRSFGKYCLDPSVYEPSTLLYVIPQTSAVDFPLTFNVLDAKEQIEAREMYWEVVSSDTNKEGYLERTEETLLGCIEKNPFVGEPHVLLSQVYLRKKRFKEKGFFYCCNGEVHGARGCHGKIGLLGFSVLLMKSQDQSWPDVSWGILNLGLVR